MSIVLKGRPMTADRIRERMSEVQAKLDFHSGCMGDLQDALRSLQDRLVIVQDPAYVAPQPSTPKTPPSAEKVAAMVALLSEEDKAKIRATI